MYDPNYLYVFNNYLRNRDSCPISYQKALSRYSYAVSNNAFTFLYIEIKRQKDLKSQEDFGIDLRKQLKRTQSLTDLDKIIS